MLRIQQKVKSYHTVEKAFSLLDSNKLSFLTLKNLQQGLPTHFDITLKKNEIVKVFKEIDQDEDAVIKFKEFREFFDKDYEKELNDLDKKSDSASIQHDIFDHIIKVLKQKNLTLAEVFDQIDTNKNGFIEVDEFSNLLERLGFTISEQQVFEILR